MNHTQSQQDLLNGVRLLTATEVVGLLHVSRGFLYKLRFQGLLSPVNMANRILRYRPQDVRAYLDAIAEPRNIQDPPSE